MKKNICIFAFLLFASSGFTQVLDTAAVVREVDSLLALSKKTVDAQKFAEAMHQIDLAENMAVTTFGKNHRSYIKCLIRRGRAFGAQGKFVEVEPLLLEAKASSERFLGKTSSEYSESLSVLGLSYISLGQYDKALPITLESKSIREKIFGENTLPVAESLSNLARIYQETGYLEQAEQLYLEAIFIWEKMNSKEAPGALGSKNNLANVYMELGQYEKSEQLYLEIVRTAAKTRGKNTTDYAGYLNNLAFLYGKMGLHEKAKALVLESKAIFEQSVGKENYQYTFILGSLAALCHDSRQYKQAEQYLWEANAILEKILGKEHPLYATNLFSLALAYQGANQHEKAMEMYLATLRIREKVLPAGHPVILDCFNNIADLYFSMGQIEEAGHLYLKVKNLRAQFQGKTHLDYAHSLKSLAKYYIQTRQIKEAITLLLENASLEQNLIKSASHHLSEQELYTYLNSFDQSNQQFFSLCLAAGTTSNHLLSASYNNIIFYKGLPQSIAAQIRLKELSGAQAPDKYIDFTACHRRLATEYAKPIAMRDSVQIVALEEKANALEKQLIRIVAGFGDAIRQVNWSEVQAELQPGEAALEFVHFNYYNPEPTDSVLYVVLLLKPDMQHPMFIPLCEEKQLQALLPAADGKLNNDQVNDLYNNDALYRLIWSPLESHLTDVRKIYYSPSGLLHRLNLAALPTSPKAVLSDRHDMVSLGSTRQLALDNQNVASHEAPAALIYGGIQFDMDSTTYRERPASHTNSPRGLSFVQTDSTLRGDTWDFLKWSEKEADNIQAALGQAGIKAQVIKGRQATEESFKQIGQTGSSPRILHISTHGFFFPDPANPKSETGNLQSNEPVFKLSDHPMIRSGLILAGANHAWKTGSPLGNREDGILTAYEISQLNLRNTKLVVLSACETGLGHIEGNEGVYGLQRAFKIAGAKTLVMSLWQVPDYQTQELMTVFYQKWLLGKMPVRQALLAAQKEMRDKGYEPYYWAGFVVVE